MSHDIRTFRFRAMGGNGSITLAGEAHDIEAATHAATHEVVRIEGRYSRYLPGNLMSQINEAASTGRSIDLDEETAGLVDYAFECYRLSEGLFDVTSGILRRAWDFSRETLPTQADLTPLLDRIGLQHLVWERPTLSFSQPGMELDLGGIGKEYAVDRCVDLCRALGFETGLLELGGDIGAIGPRPDGTPWPIAIQDPKNPDTAITTVFLSQGGIATSGDYARGITVDGKRYGHLLNPKTGWPVQGLASVTVIAPRCLAAGTIASIAMLKGPEGPEWLRKVGLEHVWVDQEGQVGS